MNQKLENIVINDRYIGKDYPCYIIAEAGINHNGDIEIAKEMVRTVKSLGADAIKFQSFTPSGLWCSNSPTNSTSENQQILKDISRLALSHEEQSELVELCRRKDITFLSTPLDVNSADFLHSIGVQAIKVASMDLITLPFLEYISRYNIPLLLSTGMGSLDEISQAISIIEENGDPPIILLHCTSLYPPIMKELQLEYISILSKKYNKSVGYSDHTLGVQIPIIAISMGAVVLEKHFTLDKTMEGPDQNISADPSEMKELVEVASIIFKSKQINDEKVSQREQEKKTSFRRSVVTKRNIHAGELLVPDMLDYKRPGVGIPPNEVRRIIGKHVLRDYKEDEFLQLSGISEED